MSKVIPGTARAAVTAGLSAALALGTLPASAIADAIVEPEAGASQEQVQTQQDAQAGQDAQDEAEGEDAGGATEGTAAASGDTAATEGEDTAEGADPETDNVVDPETAATAEADADAAASADAASEEAEASEVPPATAQEAPAADAPADVTPVANEVAKITRDGVETSYDSLTTAVNSLQDNDTLTILKTVSDNVEINNKQNVTITSTDKTAVAYQGYMKIRGGNGNKVTNIHFDVQPQLNQTTGTTSFSHRGLELFDAPNVKVENNTFTLPEDGPNTTQTVTRLDVNCLYVSGTSGGLEVRNNSFHISKHGSPNYNMTYRAIALRGHDIRVPGNNKVLDGVTIDGNTIEMTGQNSQGNATSVFVDAVGGLTNPNYGIKNVVVNSNTINGGQTASDGTTNVTFGFLAVGIDGLTFTNNTAKKLGYAVIFGSDATGTDRTQKMDNVKIGGNDLSTTVYDLYTSTNNKQDAFENHVGDGGIILTAPERGKADNSAFYAGYKDLSNSQDQLHLHSSLAKALEKVEDGKPYEVRVIQNATTGVPVPDGKDVTLDLNGCKVSGASAITGQLTVKDSSAAAAGTLSSAANVTGTGALTVESGAVDAAVTSAAGTTVTVKGGTVSGAVTSAGALNVSGGTVTGQVTGSAGSTIAVSDGTVSGDVTTAGTMNVTGGTVTGKIVAQSGANVTISGGTVGEVEAQSGSTVTIADGATITGVVTGDGDTANGATVRIEGGAFDKAPVGKEGVITIAGGSFSEKPDVLHGEDLKGFALGTDGKWHVVDASLSFTNAVTNMNGTDTYTIDIKDTITGGARYTKDQFEKLAQVVNAADHAVGLYGYSVTLDSADTIDKINDAIQNKDVTKSFELTYTAKKVGTSRDAKFEKKLAVKLVDTRVAHNVTFDTDGGTPAPNAQQIKHGELVTEPDEPTKTGHKFLGWFNGASKWNFDTSAMPDENITLKAHWEVNKHKVSFDANAGGDTSVTGMPNEITDVAWNTAAAEPGDDPTREGYTFEGWYKDADGQTPYEWSDRVMGDLTLYAKWEIKKFTVTFDGNGGNDTVTGVPGRAENVEWNTSVAVPDAEPVRAGYTFDGWYADKATSADKKFVFGTTKVTGDLTLYAKWVANYTLVFDGNGGGDAVTDLPDTIKGKEGDVIAKPAKDPKRTGYAFDAWYTDPTTQNDSTKYDWSQPLEKGQTLYAGWKIESYTLTFNAVGGAGTFNEQQVTYREKANNPGDPAKEGHDFLGWFDKQGNKWEFDTNTMPAENVELTASWKVQKRTITLDPNGGELDSLPQTVEADYGTAATKPTGEPVMEGHDFAGWYTDAAGTVEYQWGTPLQNDITLYAKWSVRSYRMSFDSNGGKETFEAQDVNYGDLVNYPGDPTKDGYTFVGWYYEPTGTEWDFNGIGMPAEDLTLTARWAPREYTATFDWNYENAPKSDTATIYHDGYVAFPVDPKRDGYEFAGWFKDAAATEPYDRNTKVTGDITLYAKWVAGVNQVTFDSDGGTNVPGVAVGTDGLIPRPNPDPVKPGHVFQGWFRQDGTAWDFARDKMPAEDITLVAHWKLQTFDVTFDVAGGESETPATQKVEYQKLATKPADPTRDGYDFAGWVDQDGKAYDFTTPVEGNIALTAQWSAQDRTVTFESNGGSKIQSQTVKYDTVAQQPADPTREGYDFGGWYTTRDFADGSAYDFSAKVTGDVTLYAKWQVKTFSVRFEANAGGDSTVANIPGNLDKVEWNTTVSNPTLDGARKPTRTGYTFTGWYADADAKAPFDFERTLIAADTVIYAGWAINVYTLHFDANAGQDAVTNVPADLPVNHGGTLTEPQQQPEREGYEFDGWYTDGGNQTAATRFDWAKPLTAGQTVFAKWKAKTYKLVFDVAGGQGAFAEQSVSYRSFATNPGNPTKAGYTFAGWFNGSAQWDFTQSTMPAGDVILAAKWLPLEYTVTFDQNYQGAPAAGTAKAYHDGTVATPNDPQREGYEFAGWYTTKDLAEGSRYDFSAKVTGDVTLYAKWTQRETPAPGPEEKPNPDPGDNPETQPEEKPEVGPDDNKPETEPEVKPDPGEQPEDKPGVDPEPGDQPEVGPETKPETNPDMTPEETPEAGGQPTGDSKQPADANDVQKAVQPATLPKTNDANNAVIPAAIAVIGSAFLGLAAMLHRRKDDF